MAGKIDTKVFIGGKELTLSGYESEDYLQTVATYLNKKMDECSRLESFKRLPADMQNVLLQLNIADDFFKAKDQVNMLEAESSAKDDEISTLKHDLVALQMKMGTMEKNLEKIRNEQREAEKTIVRLETELKDYKR